MTATLPPGITMPVPEGQGHPSNVSPWTTFDISRFVAMDIANGNDFSGMLFDSAEKLLWSCQEYFTWCENNPLYNQETRYDTKKFKWVTTQIPRRRLLTTTGLCRFLMISTSTWGRWKKDPRFRNVIEYVNSYIYDQNLEGAAADQFNAQVVIRHLGLADKQEVDMGIGAKRDIESDMSPQDAAEAYLKEING